MREVMGEARYAAYILDAPHLDATVKTDILRAGLSECIRSVYYFYGAYGVGARSRSDVTNSML